MLARPTLGTTRCLQGLMFATGAPRHSVAPRGMRAHYPFRIGHRSWWKLDESLNSKLTSIVLKWLFLLLEWCSLCTFADKWSAPLFRDEYHIADLFFVGRN